MCAEHRVITGVGFYEATDSIYYPKQMYGDKMAAEDSETQVRPKTAGQATDFLGNRELHKTKTLLNISDK